MPKPQDLIQQAIHQPQLDAAWSRGPMKQLKREIGDQWGPRLAAIASDRAAPADDRRQALDLLQLFGPVPDAELVLRLSQDPNVVVRAKATYLLGLTGGDVKDFNAIDARLGALLDDPQPLVQRLACESLVRSRHPGPAGKLISLLGSSDHYLAWAAMCAIEELPVACWQPLVLKAESPQAFLMGSVALLAMGCERPAVDAILAQSRKLLAGSLFAEGERVGPFRADLFRIIQLCLIRASLEGDQVPELRDQLSKMYPQSDWRANRELIRLLVYLQDPTFAARLVHDLEGKLPVVEKIHLAMYARFLTVGWTPELRDRLLKFYESTKPLSGGNSFHGYIANATRDFLGTISASEKARRITDGAKTPETTIELLQKLPEPLPPEYMAALRRLDRELIGDNAPRPANWPPPFSKH